MGVVLIARDVPQQTTEQQEVATAKLVGVMRFLNTYEYSYMNEHRRFADRGQMVEFLRQKGLLSKLPLNVEDLQPYELAITTSSDGMHYQITLQRPSDMNDKSTWCKTALFSDDRGAIFRGLALGCEAAQR
jgi:hypothetical protein